MRNSRPINAVWNPVLKDSEKVINYKNKYSKILVETEKEYKFVFDAIEAVELQIDSIEDRINDIQNNADNIYFANHKKKKLLKEKKTLQEKLESEWEKLPSRKYYFGDIYSHKEVYYKEIKENLKTLNKLIKESNNSNALTVNTDFIDEIEDLLNNFADTSCRDQSPLFEELLGKIELLEAVEHPYTDYYNAMFCALKIDNYCVNKDEQEIYRQKLQKLGYLQSIADKYSHIRRYCIGMPASSSVLDANFDDYGYDGTDIDVSDM